MHTRPLLVLALASFANAHMSLWYPAPLGGNKEANPQSQAVDPELNFPLGCCDEDGQPSLPSPGICRGHLDLIDTETPSVTWSPGQRAYFQLSDRTYTPGAPGGTHYGGSCQVGFSVDGGRTWKVAASYNGGCPHRTDGSEEAQRFDFTVPTGMPLGKAVFAWVWLNREHESFMNCAWVEIAAASSDEEDDIHGKGSLEDGRDKTGKDDGSSQGLQVRDPGYHHHHHHHHHRDHTLCPCPPGNSRCIFPSGGKQPEPGAVGSKPTRPHRRDRMRRKEQPRPCDWASAPEMQVSYYTVDADCAPGAKERFPVSDDFEVAWDGCGVVEGDGEYPTELFSCSLYQ